VTQFSGKSPQGDKLEIGDLAGILLDMGEKCHIPWDTISMPSLLGTN